MYGNPFSVFLVIVGKEMDWKALLEKSVSLNWASKQKIFQQLLCAIAAFDGACFLLLRLLSKSP